MEEIVLQTRNLTKKYKYATALDNVNLSLKRGHIYGFIGNNGAGKTTFMRAVMGLTFANSGEIALFGKSGVHDLERARGRIGALIEQAVGYDNMTAKRNLILEQMLLEKKGEQSIDELLDSLGISAKGSARGALRSFSVGMRQRYGLAAALLGDPEFLILDEPTSGLDPAGTKDLREMFLRLNREKGVTMLISSHILTELYQVATDFIFIDNGKILREMTHEELDADREGKNGTIDDYFLNMVAEAREKA